MTSDQASRPLRYVETEDGPAVLSLEGAITTCGIPANELPKGRDHIFKITFQYDHPRFAQVQDQKPPLHFHASQAEWMRVLQGRLRFEVEGQERVLTAADGEVCIEPWTHHRLLVLAPSQDDPAVAADDNRCVFLLSAADADQQTFKLDEDFYENWFSYQEGIVVRGEKISILQVLIMFDAGGSYLSLPRWVPFGKYISYYVLGIGMGRYLAAMLGYQPYYREWTNESRWEQACRKMETTFFQRRFAKRDMKED